MYNVEITVDNDEQTPGFKVGSRGIKVGKIELTVGLNWETFG